MSSTDYARMNNDPLVNNYAEDRSNRPPRGASEWNDDGVLSDNDFEPPCPYIAEHCPYPCCCCCALSRSHRQQCALSLLYAKFYLCIYLLIIAMTLTLLIFDLAKGNIIHNLQSEPVWFVIVDICCVTLMVFDVFVQMMAHPRSYWKSAMNVFDFVVVLLCVVSIPVYFYVPDSDFILTVVLLLRFAAQLLRIVMVYKHHENRSAYMETTRDDLVDFTGFDDAAAAAQNNGADANESRDLTDVQSRTTTPSLYPSTLASSYQNALAANTGLQNNGRVVIDAPRNSHYNRQWE